MAAAGPAVEWLQHPHVTFLVSTETADSNDRPSRRTHHPIGAEVILRQELAFAKTHNSSSIGQVLASMVMAEDESGLRSAHSCISLRVEISVSKS